MVGLSPVTTFLLLLPELMINCPALAAAARFAFTLLDFLLAGPTLPFDTGVALESSPPYISMLCLPLAWPLRVSIEFTRWNFFRLPWPSVLPPKIFFAILEIVGSSYAPFGFRTELAPPSLPSSSGKELEPQATLFLAADKAWTECPLEPREEGLKFCPASMR